MLKQIEQISYRGGWVNLEFLQKGSSCETSIRTYILEKKTYMRCLVSISRWWQLKYLFSPRNPAEMIQFDLRICFKWVGKNHQLEMKGNESWRVPPLFHFTMIMGGRVFLQKKTLRVGLLEHICHASRICHHHPRVGNNASRWRYFRKECVGSLEGQTLCNKVAVFALKKQEKQCLVQKPGLIWRLILGRLHFFFQMGDVLRSINALMKPLHRTLQFFSGVVSRWCWGLVECGSRHTLCLTFDGLLVGFGCNSEGAGEFQAVCVFHEGWKGWCDP